MSALTKISDHVYCLSPGPPDRPSLCAVAGTRRPLMLDAGSSAAHARIALNGFSEMGIASPFSRTRTGITSSVRRRSARSWVAEGIASEQHAANVKEELPSPREVQVAQADIVFEGGLDLELGGVTVRVRHVAGD